MRSDGKKWSEFGWSMGRERMDRRRERARKENDVGFLKPPSNGFIEGVLSSFHEEGKNKRAGYKLIRAVEFGFKLQFSQKNIDSSLKKKSGFIRIYIP